MSRRLYATIALFALFSGCTGMHHDGKRPLQKETPQISIAARAESGFSYLECEYKSVGFIIAPDVPRPGLVTRLLTWNDKIMFVVVFDTQTQQTIITRVRISDGSLQEIADLKILNVSPDPAFTDAMRAYKHLQSLIKEDNMPKEVTCRTDR